MSFILLNRTYYLKWPNKPLSLPMLQSTHFWINIIFLMTLPFLNNFSCVCIKFYGLLDLFVPFESLTKPWNTNYFAKESEIWHLHTFCISGYKLIIFFFLCILTVNSWRLQPKFLSLCLLQCWPLDECIYTESHTL